MGRSLDIFGNLPWASFKEAVQARKIKLQWVEVHNVYYLAAKDDGYTFECMLKKTDPINADQTDFEDNFKANANKNEAVKTNTTGVLKVAVEKPDDPSTTIVSHDWCDSTTWYGQSARSEGVALTLKDGTTDTFETGAKSLIDVIHGKIYEEDLIASTYKPIVYDDGTPLVEDVDYITNYLTGEFVVQPAYTVQGTLTADFSKATCSGFLLTPTEGKILIIEHTELNFSKDSFIDQPIYFEIWVGNPYFNPGEPIVDYDPDIPINEHNCLRFPYKRKTYKNEKDIINASNLGQGSIPKFGNLPDDILIFPFQYVTVTAMKSSQLVELRIRLANDKDENGNMVPLTGSYGTVSFYVISQDE